MFREVVPHYLFFYVFFPFEAEDGGMYLFHDLLLWLWNLCSYDKTSSMLEMSKGIYLQ